MSRTNESCKSVTNYDSFHWTSYIPGIHKIEKLRFLGSRKLRFYGLIWIWTEEFNFLDLVDFRGAAFAVVSMIISHPNITNKFVLQMSRCMRSGPTYKCNERVMSQIWKKSWNRCLRLAILLTITASTPTNPVRSHTYTHYIYIHTLLWHTYIGTQVYTHYACTLAQMHTRIMHVP